MKKFFLLALIAMSAGLISCTKTATTTQETQKDDLSQQVSQELAALRLAVELAHYGYESESAFALIEAADIIASMPMPAMRADDEKVTKNPFIPEAMLKAAREWAKDDAHLLALADKVQAKLEAEVEVTRGRMPGSRPPYTRGRVYAHSYICYSCPFQEGVLAEVGLVGDGDTDLELYAYDSVGNLLASDTEHSRTCYVSFRVKETGMYMIKIVNRGNVYNDFMFVTN